MAAAPGISGVRLGKRRIGAAYVALETGGHGTADRFEQASSDGNLKLRQVVDEWVQPRTDARILELYAGSGNFTRVLADSAREVVAVERAGETPDIPRVTWIAGDAASVTPDLAAKSEAFDWVVLDPPRTGAKDVLPALLTLGASRILYVSCDLATLSRDLDTLCQAKYRAVRALPLDLMPQTAHVEVVVELLLNQP